MLWTFSHTYLSKTIQTQVLPFVYEHTQCLHVHHAAFLSFYYFSSPTSDHNLQYLLSTHSPYVALCYLQVFSFMSFIDDSIFLPPPLLHMSFPFALSSMLISFIPSHPCLQILLLLPPHLHPQHCGLNLLQCCFNEQGWQHSSFFFGKNFNRIHLHLLLYNPPFVTTSTNLLTRKHVSSQPPLGHYYQSLA